MMDEYISTSTYVDSTSHVTFGDECRADEAATEKHLANPNAMLKSAWVHIEVMDVARTVKAHSLLEIALALIALIHGEEPLLK